MKMILQVLMEPVGRLPALAIIQMRLKRAAALLGFDIDPGISTQITTQGFSLFAVNTYARLDIKPKHGHFAQENYF